MLFFPSFFSSGIIKRYSSVLKFAKNGILNHIPLYGIFLGTSKTIRQFKVVIYSSLLILLVSLLALFMDVILFKLWKNKLGYNHVFERSIIFYPKSRNFGGNSILEDGQIFNLD